jgi:hypothetical protein
VVLGTVIGTRLDRHATMRFVTVLAAVAASGIYLGVSLSGPIGAAGLEVLHVAGLRAGGLTLLAAVFVAAGLGASEVAARRARAKQQPAMEAL